MPDWHEHTTGRQPVPDGVMVRAWLRDDQLVRAPAERLDWSIGSEPHQRDILGWQEVGDDEQVSRLG